MNKVMLPLFNREKFCNQKKEKSFTTLIILNNYSNLSWNA